MDKYIDSRLAGLWLWGKIWGVKAKESSVSSGGCKHSEIVLMVAQFCDCITNHQITQFKWVNGKV